MSGSSRRRRSKWDENDSETLFEDSYDRVPPPRPREPSSPGKDSRRHDSRNRSSTVSLEREENGTKISPKLEERRPRHSSRSPRNEWGRSHRVSRSRSRSQSPAHHFRRELAPNDRNRSRSRQVCRDFTAGKCRKGKNCNFLHQNDDQSYDNRRPLERGSPDESEGRYRRAGSSRYSIEDIKDNSIRAEKTANICNDFLKGRCRRGDACRYMHHDNRDHDHRSRDGRSDYQDRDHRSRDTYPEHDPDVDTGHDRGMDSYSDHDHRRKDMHPKRDHESDSSRKGEMLCKFFASGNCRNGTRCRFSHQVQDGFSPERSRDVKRDTDYKFEDRHGWEVDENETKEVNALRVQDDERGSEPKFEGDRVHDWRDEKNEISGVVNDMTRPEGDSLDHNMVIKPTWDPTNNTIDKFQIPDNEDLLRWKTENNVPIMDFSTSRDQSINQSTNQHEVGFGEGRVYSALPLSSDNREAGDMEISPRDIKQHTMFDPNSQIQSISDISFPMQNTIHNDNAPQFYPSERSDVIGNHNVSSIIQDQGQDIFQPYGNSGFNPILNKTPQGEGIQEVSHYPSSNLENRVDGSHVGSIAGSEPGLGSTTQTKVSDEQLAQLSHITASLTQLIENQQQISQSSSVISPRGMPPELGTMIEPNQGPVSTSTEEKMPNLGDQSLPIVEPKRAISEIDEISKLNPREHLEAPKDEENGKEKVGFRERENGPSRGVGLDDGADDGKRIKDTKGVRPFKFALAEFIKELLKPSWKDGQVSKEAYKIIVKKAVEKVMETLGPQVPQTKEKIDMYLSCSKPKIDKLVQAYVGKHQKG